MGTNYYLHTKPPCECCGREFEDSIKHIGKSSWGWMFSLHVYPYDGILELDDWMPLLTAAGHIIKNEYGEDIHLETLLDIITNRTKPYQEYYEKNPQLTRYQHAPMRHTVDGRHCIGHGAGDYDLNVGDFS